MVYDNWDVLNCKTIVINWHSFMLILLFVKHMVIHICCILVITDTKTWDPPQHQWMSSYRYKNSYYKDKMVVRRNWYHYMIINHYIYSTFLLPGVIILIPNIMTQQVSLVPCYSTPIAGNGIIRLQWVPCLTWWKISMTCVMSLWQYLVPFY